MGWPQMWQGWPCSWQCALNRLAAAGVCASIVTVPPRYLVQAIVAVAVIIAVAVVVGVVLPFGEYPGCGVLKFARCTAHYGAPGPSGRCAGRPCAWAGGHVAGRPCGIAGKLNPVPATVGRREGSACCCVCRRSTWSMPWWVRSSVGACWCPVSLRFATWSAGVTPARGVALTHP